MNTRDIWRLRRKQTVANKIADEADFTEGQPKGVIR
jgi:hypothetical protein